MQKYLFFVLAALSAITVQAQRRGRGYKQLNAQMTMRTAITDSLVRIGQSAAERIDSLATVYNTKHQLNLSEDQDFISTSTIPEVFSNPYFFPLFASKTLLHTPLHYTISLPFRSVGTNATASHSFDPKEVKAIVWPITEAYVQHPEVFIYDLTESVAESRVQVNRPEGTAQPTMPVGDKGSDATVGVSSVHFEENIREENTDVFDFDDFTIHVRRPNFWTFKGAFSTQFMQYHVSDNWYKGGEDHLSMLGTFNIEANYDNKKKVTFTNKLETKLGFQTSPSDTEHRFKTNADLLRLTNKLGVQAHSHWYYTAMLQSWTQFYKAFKANSQTVSSDFMSPFESVFSLGMDYKLQKKRVNLSATISPGAVNLKYCDREAIVKNHGIDEGKHYRLNLGSTITMNMTLKFCEQVNWVTRLYAFYDYKGNVKSEWENTINLKVNKYLSTKLFLYPRFDNSVTKKNPDDSYFQFNEYLSVGLDLNF